MRLDTGKKKKKVARSNSSIGALGVLATLSGIMAFAVLFAPPSWNPRQNAVMAPARTCRWTRIGFGSASQPAMPLLS